MTTAGTQMNRKEKRAETAEMPEMPETLMEMCTVRLGTTVFGVPITHILEIVGAARPQPIPWRPSLWAGWSTIAATCSPR